MFETETAETDPVYLLPPHPINARWARNPEGPRERRSRGYTSSSSSDAPLFSSDDLAEATVDKYASPRRKQQHRRAWWQDDSMSGTVSSRPSKCRARFLDSGVFMASDSSSGGDDGFDFDLLKTPAPKRRRIQDITQGSPRKLPLGRRSDDDPAKRLVLKCVEDGNEVVDLSNIGLATIPDNTFQPLHFLIRSVKIQDVRAEDAYRTLRPDLKIFLNSNLLQAIPKDIMQLEALTVLSLRNNNIEVLPGSIGNLCNLQELNVAGNKLRSLPWELLRLVDVGGKLKTLNVLPNPLLKPLGNDPVVNVSIRPDLEDRQWANGVIQKFESKLPQAMNESESVNWILHLCNILNERARQSNSIDITAGLGESNKKNRYQEIQDWEKQPVYFRSSNWTFFDFDGTLPSPTISAPSSLSHSDLVDFSEPSPLSATISHSCRRPRTSRTPTLLEIALRTCAQAANAHELALHPPEELPTSAQNLLVSACHPQAEGIKVCSVCHGNYIIVGAEWIEWWHCLPDTRTCSLIDIAFPFVRRSCSWRCVQSLLAKEPETEVKQKEQGS